MDTQAFRQALSTFMTGVTIVTTRDSQNRQRGFTANSFTSVSLQPPLVLICIAKNADAVDAFTHAPGFAVNILTEEQQAISTAFATKEPNKFDFVKTRPGVTGSPLIDGCMGWFDCVKYNQIEAGDHIILIGEVSWFGMANGDPLGYWRGGYVTLGMQTGALGVNHALATYVGSIVGWQGRVMLQQRTNDWQVPNTRVEGNLVGHDDRLAKLLSELELHADIDFLYSVFETADSGENYIFYRGSLMRSPTAARLSKHRLALFDHDTLPWQRLPNQETEIMLRRYFKESDIGSFGIYADAVGGSVSGLSGRPRNWRET